MSRSARHTSVTTSAVSREQLHKLAVESAFEIESTRRTIARWLAIGAGVVVTLSCMAFCGWLGLGLLEILLGGLAGVMFAIPLGLAVSALAVPLGALAARRRFMLHTRALGLSDVDAKAAYTQATQVIDDLTRGRLVTGAQHPSSRK